MSLSVIFIVVLVFCAMLGPVLMLKLNKRQQSLANLRHQALVVGLKVKMAQLNKEPVAVYLLEWPQQEDTRFGDRLWKLERKNYVHPIHLADHWYWAEDIKPNQEDAVVAILTAAVSRLPASVKAISADPRGLGCYWSESGGEAALIAIGDWLKEIQPRLWPLVRTVDDEPSEQASDRTAVIPDQTP